MRVGELGVVRTAALPVTTVDRLAFDHTTAEVRSILLMEDQLGEEGRQLAEALHEIVGSPAISGQQRRQLIRVRRSLFNARLPKAGEWTGTLAAVMPADLSVRVDAWLDRCRSVGRARERLVDSLAAERDEKAATLREIALAAEFARATAMASPVLHDEITRWAANPSRRPNARKLSHLAVYVARASMKTSPFSLFTASRLARWTDEDTALRTVVSRDPHAVLEVDAEYLDRLAFSLVRRPELADAVVLRVNPSAVPIGAHLEFIGPPPSEALVRVANSEAVAAAVRVLRTNPAISRSELVSALAAAAGGDTAAASRYLTRLIEVGLVETHLPVPDSAPDWLGSCAAWLRTEASGRLEGVASAMESASAGLRLQIPPARIPEHRARCDDVRSALSAAAVGLADAVRPPILYENAVDPSETILGSRWWQPVLADLDILRPWLGIFDFHLPKRIAVQEFHAQRFGQGSAVPLLTLYRAVLEETLAGRSAVGDAFRPGDPSRSQDAMLAGSTSSGLRELLDLRALARSSIAVACDADGVVRIAPELLAKQVAEWPRWLEPPATLACYLQLCSPDGPDPAVVLNAAHSGNGRSTARLRHLLGSADQAPRTGEHLAELAGRHGSTLNVRSSTTADELAYPFVPGKDHLRLADLLAVHDRDDGVVRLHHAERGGLVRPAQLGLMSTDYLPPLARFLTQVFSMDWCHHPGTLSLVPFDLLGEARPILAYPRIEVGHVTIRRAGWLMSSREVPRRGRAETDAGFLIRLHRWFHTLGIPPKCFVRTWPRADDAAGRAGAARVRNRSGKPLALDLANVFLVPAFEHLVADASLVMFEEQLPAAANGVKRGAARFVTEFVLEVAAESPDE